jgi:hypothetical protein
MQEIEFNNLINGKEAKWMEMQKPSPFDNPLYITNTSRKEEIRDVIAENEKPVPADIREAVNKFVTQERAKKKSERAIRRAVKRKWNIIIV